MKLKGKKIAVLAEKFYEDLELWYPVLRFREEGATVHVIGPEAATYGSKHDYPAKADLAIKDARVADYDALIIPGGYAPDHMRRHPPMIQFVKDADARGIVVAAICHGGWMLASARIVKGKKLTGFFSIRDDMENAGALWQDAEVVKDRNLITSRTPSDLPAFCRTIIETVASAVVA